MGKVQPDMDTMGLFLSRVWSEQPGAPRAFISCRNGKQWSDKGVDPSQRIKTWPNKGFDLYFTPNVFKALDGGRRHENMWLSSWLYADLDEVDPRSLPIPPTIAWETSMGHYQCMWYLPRSLTPKNHEKLNKHLTYYVGADKSGWDRTQVLRIPGSVSTKYDKPFFVRLLWDDGQTYAPKAIWEQVRRVSIPHSDDKPPPDLALPELTSSTVQHKYSLPSKARRLIAATRVKKDDDRSARLWELECLLLKAGVPPEEALIVARDTVWNKYRGQRRELRQLWTEINKAKKNVGIKVSQGAGKFQREGYTELLNADLPAPDWMVEGVWSQNAHGLIAGQSKSYKSTIALDLAISVASGTPFLGQFEIPERGPVLFVQEENTRNDLQARLKAISRSRGLLKTPEPSRSMSNGQVRVDFSAAKAKKVPIEFLNNKRVDLGSDDDMEKLEEAVKEMQPKLLVLDPLYLLTPGVDENSAHAMVPILNRLLHLKHDYDLGILVVHHYKKQDHNHPIRGGERISGTSAFYRWFESALYMERTDDPFTVKMTPEHRTHPPQGVIQLEFNDFNTGYEVYVERAKEKAAARFDQLREIVSMNEGISVSKLARAIGEKGKDPRTIRRQAQGAGLRVTDGDPQLVYSK